MKFKSKKLGAVPGSPPVSLPPSAASAVAYNPKKKENSVPTSRRNPTPGESNRVFPREQISTRAREIWERKGRPEGRDLENWIEAERELREANDFADADCIMDVNGNPADKADESLEEIGFDPGQRRSATSL